MTQKLINFMSVFKKASVDGEPLKIRGFASTVAVDRAGDTILSSAWNSGLENYTKNPIILFNHDYDDPIGKCTSIKIVPQGLEIEAEISPSSEVYNFIKEGILKTFSVGFAINDAEWDDHNNGLRITSAELYEISVVSVPCNQDSVFSVAKSFASAEEYENYKSKLTSHSLAAKEVKTSRPVSDTSAKAQMEKTKMDPEEIKALVEKAARDAAAAVNKARDEAEAAKAAELAKAAAAEAAKAADAATVKTAITSGLTEGAERLYADLEAKMAARDADAGAILAGQLAEIKEASADLTKMRESKRLFGDRSGGDWKTDKSTYAEVEDAFILGLASRKGFEGTSRGKEVLQKVNAMSGVQVSSADFEQEVSTNIERDIQAALILAPLFREIQMNSATQIIPIAPDSGYAQITSSQTASGSNPAGNLAKRGDTYGAPYGGVPLTELTLSTVKLISQSYLGVETEEDAIIPILPLIRDAIVRSHARGVEQAMLLGNHADGVYTSGAFNGLVKIASTGSRNIQSATAYASEALTGAQLLTARKAMGKYGIDPRDVAYIVSQRSYFELLQDTAFQDWNQVHNTAVKMTGEVGSIYGSKVMVCDEFATPAVSKHYALAVNTRNFVVPRLRGMRMESEYRPTLQSTALVGTQRMGFSEIIAGATSVVSLQYKAI